MRQVTLTAKAWGHCMLTWSLPVATSVGEGQRKLGRACGQWPGWPWTSQAKSSEDFTGHGSVSGEGHHAHSPLTLGTEQDVGTKGALKKLCPRETGADFCGHRPHQRGNEVEGPLPR